MLLYDADCRLCRFVARLVARIDIRSELAVLPLQDLEAASLLESLTAEERLDSWRLALPDGSLPGYGAGLVALAGSLRATRPLRRALGALPAGALDTAYRLGARHRSRIGRLVPDGAAPRRFP